MINNKWPFNSDDMVAVVILNHYSILYGLRDIKSLLKFVTDFHFLVLLICPLSCHIAVLYIFVS